MSEHTAEERARVLEALDEHDRQLFHIVVLLTEHVGRTTRQLRQAIEDALGSDDESGGAP